eukprot:6470313-Pyramimonas_sp.AAC.1
MSEAWRTATSFSHGGTIRPPGAAPAALPARRKRRAELSARGSCNVRRQATRWIKKYCRLRLDYYVLILMNHSL